MDYHLEWHVPKRVLLLRVSGNITLEDLEHFNADIVSHLNEGCAPVHLVSIGDNIKRVPTNLMEIKRIVTYVRHPHMGWTIIVQEKANPVTGFMVSVAAQATGMKLYQVKNVSDGLESLSRFDQSIVKPIALV